MTEPRYPHRHLLGIQGLGPLEITAILDLADGYVAQNRSDEKALSKLPAG